jgi:ribosomal-protein-alanine N-acetyltransferase
MNPDVRPAEPADAQALAALHAAAFERAWAEASFEALLADPGAIAVLAAGQGFALARVAADEVEVLTIAVAPQARRRGVGGALLDAVLRAARARGVRTAYLDVAADNAAAAALYARFGFATAGRRKAYYARPDGAADAIVMQRAL